VVDQVPVTLALAGAPSPSACAGPVLLSATLTPGSVPGTVQFFDGATPLGSATISGGHATLLVPAGFATGTHSLSASFAGDGCYTSASGTASQVVTRAPVVLTLVTSGTPSSWGAALVLTATAAPAAASGNVEFFDGATSLGTMPLSGGAVAVSVSTLEVGAHSLTAVYSGDPCYAPAASLPRSQMIDPVVTASALVADPNPSPCGAALDLVATVSPAGAAGAVQFLDGPTVLGSAPLSGGTATLPVATLTVGAHSLTAAYLGDPHHAPATSAAVAHQVALAPVTVTLVADANPVVHGAAVTFTATLTPAAATGAVVFVDSLNDFAQATVSGGVANVTTSSLAGGAHTQIVAYYVGDGCRSDAQSAPWTELVYRAPSAVTLTSDMNPAVAGLGPTLRAHLTPDEVTGSVEFFNGATSLGSAPIAGNPVAFACPPLPVGVAHLTVTCSGDGSFEPSSSAPLDLSVIADAPPVATVLYPNGGEVLTVGAVAALAWTATDDQGVASVTISVSRDSGQSWQPIATDVPNTGSFSWLVTPPQTNTGGTPRYSALVRVVAKDGYGLTGGDVSDATFAIFSTSTAVGAPDVPAEFALARVWPNPAAGAFRVEFALARASAVRLSIVDPLGREVAVLASGDYAAGRYVTLHDGGARKRPLAAGVYFARLEAGGRVFTRRFVLIR
jgi:hypothetical protein